MNTINEFMVPYLEFESSIRTLMAELCSDTCGLCTACCCRTDICEEALESAFLKQLLAKQGLSQADMDDRIGWLDLSGCTLEYGKPPVCYAYFCDQLLARLPNDEARFVISVLGKLIYHIGQNALGSWHLVEIMNPADLEKIDLLRLSERLDDARAAYEVIGHYIQAGRLTAADHQVLQKITTEDP